MSRIFTNLLPLLDIDIFFLLMNLNNMNKYLSKIRQYFADPINRTVIIALSIIFIWIVIFGSDRIDNLEDVFVGNKGQLIREVRKIRYKINE